MELALVLLGAIFVTYGWYWGGISEARTTAYAVGFISLILGLTAAFQGSVSVTAGSLVALGAAFGVLAAANAWNESAQDRTYGLFALFFALGAFMAVAATGPMVLRRLLDDPIAETADPLTVRRLRRVRDEARARRVSRRLPEGSPVG